ncbi:alginate O-acetyltransferase [Candidatus Protochlamydia naegleriophila]|uniref:Alginate O-acetyltransferase n=1 Tax=Candidatus Protochlamydia naegleriophila TaxID=389348 RepID=A0A0U5JBM3_9BACT|nr:MBOAT family O-acyltransferase [Candidatus Protochlamydia naegleriophila]CUI16814.1 alginate O-acetyltransferase [Candidatus Protochlamydia naegleriophila]
MLFNSYSFLLLYLPVVLTGFFGLAKLRLTQAARAWLLFSSLFFYAYWDIRFLPLLLASIFFNYGCGKTILQASERIKKIILCLGVGGDLALLFYFKYYNFFLGMFTDNSLIEVLLPLGISFFTFTQIAYLVDAYQGKADSCDIISYGLFVTVFPHLIAGPILHHKEMLKQFTHLRMYVVSWPHIAQGCFLFVIGICKKVMIADHLAVFVKPVFDNAFVENIAFVQAWFAALSYTLQLYFDFSGYSDMAVGLGLLFNLHLPINFNSPYKADSIIDFWRRWHITLSNFLRDYLYISLGGNRQGQIAKWRNLLLTMLLGGLWHGAGWTFVVWGACHGCFLVINHLWRHFKLSMPRMPAKVLTLLAVIFSWVIFRSPDLPSAFNIISGMLGLNGIVLPVSYETHLAFLKSYGVHFINLLDSNFRFYDIIILATLCAVVLWLPNSNEWLQRFKKNPTIWAVPCGLLFALVFLQLDSLAEFLYYQF